MQMQGAFRFARSAFFLLMVLRAMAVAQSATQGHRDRPPEYTFEVVNRFPHDPDAFTQGFAYHAGFFYEGTGRKGSSSLRQEDPETGKIIRKVDLSSEYFGEGIAILGDKIFQLTWLSHTGFVYDLSSFRELRRFQYEGEGWGLTADGRDLFMSDGTAVIRVLNPNTFQVKRRLRVHDGKAAVNQLNELEFVEGEIFANIWHSNRIARISPQTGEIVGWIDLSGLMGSFYRLDPEAVLNGIAYDQQHKRLFVTGKLWPSVFEIHVVPSRSTKH
jgi:glutaminyl-peptide cyclotransferase